MSIQLLIENFYFYREGGPKGHKPTGRVGPKVTS